MGSQVQYPSVVVCKLPDNSVRDATNGILAHDIELPQHDITNVNNDGIPKDCVDYCHRGQWVRAAILGANDGLVSTASLMMGVGAVKEDAKAMVVSGLAGLVAGACSMAIGEFVSVYSQRDAELSQMRRTREEYLRASEEVQARKLGETLSMSCCHRKSEDTEESIDDIDERLALQEEDLPNPVQAACASALAFATGSVVPLLSAAFIKEHVLRVGVLIGVSSAALAIFGALGAVLGGGHVVKGSIRVLVGGWIAMLITYGLLHLFGTAGV